MEDTMQDNRLVLMRGLSKLHKLPWTANPETYQDEDGLTLQARLAEEAVAVLRRSQRDAFGDSYDEDTDGLWQAMMDGTIETHKECLDWIRRHCH